MTELQILQEDLERFRTLHSWYKWNYDVTIFPLLQFGQQPYQPISPQTNSKYDNELRWYFLIDPKYNEYYSIFEKNKNISKKLFEISKKYSLLIRLNKLGGSEDTSIMVTLMTNAQQFYLETKEIYDELKISHKKNKIEKCKDCSLRYHVSLGCFGSQCNHDIFSKYKLKGFMYISDKNQITFEHKKDTALFDFVFDYFKNNNKYQMSINTNGETKFNANVNGSILQLRIFYVAKMWHAHVEYDNKGHVILSLIKQH